MSWRSPMLDFFDFYGQADFDAIQAVQLDRTDSTSDELFLVHMHVANISSGVVAAQTNGSMPGQGRCGERCLSRLTTCQFGRSLPD